MIVIGSAVVILVISFLLALRSVKHELSVPSEVTEMKGFRPNAKKGGVILFFKEKIVHYSSEEASPTASSSDRDAGI